MQVNAYAASSPAAPLAPFSIERRVAGPRDVSIDILYCGVCHSDLHAARGEWPGVMFPCVPGHEIVGKITAMGSAVENFKLGQVVGVGCIVDSCRHCQPCTLGLEQYCASETGFMNTYNGGFKGGTPNTYGGYSENIVVDERYVLAVRHPEKDLAAVAPLLCAGITTWSPLKHWGAGPGKTVGVVGIGGLGHMGIKLARAMGAHVVAFTTSESKVDDARSLGAHDVVVSKDAQQMAGWIGKLDFILNCAAVSHDLDTYLALLKLDGSMSMVGVPSEPHPSPSMFSLIAQRRSLAGSLIGGIAETQEMLDFCAEHGIVSDIEMISMLDIDPAYDRMLKGDVRYRFVIDMATLRAE